MIIFCSIQKSCNTGIVSLCIYVHSLWNGDILSLTWTNQICLASDENDVAGLMMDHGNGFWSKSIESKSSGLSTSWCLSQVDTLNDTVRYFWYCFLARRHCVWYCDYLAYHNGPSFRWLFAHLAHLLKLVSMYDHLPHGLRSNVATVIFYPCYCRIGGYFDDLAGRRLSKHRESQPLYLESSRIWQTMLICHLSWFANPLEHRYCWSPVRSTSYRTIV